jgi:hypothetical protein
MSGASGKSWHIAAAMLLLLTLTTGARAATVEDLVRDTQRITTASGQMTMVWWIPQEFWEVSLAARPSSTPEERAQILGTLEDYQIMGLLRARTGIGALTDVQTRADLLSNARFEVDGKIIDPVAPDKITFGAQALVAGLKPALAGILGQMGQSMELVVYPSKKDNVRLIDPRKAGTFQYTLYDQTFHWRTPLGSLLPKKTDPKTKEEFPGDYQYNPYTGSKLVAN